jgi:hypothetical protein
MGRLSRVDLIVMIFREKVYRTNAFRAMFLSQCIYVIVAGPVRMDSLQLDDVTRDTSARIKINI